MSPEQAHYMRLLKMVIASKRFVQAQPLHDNETDAIDKRPFFVRSLLQEEPGCIKYR